METPNKAQKKNIIKNLEINKKAKKNSNNH